MWKLPDGTVTSRPKDITISGVVYNANMLYTWTIQEMNDLGIYPYREVQYDGAYYRSTGLTEEIVDGEVVATHSTEPSYTVSGLQALKKSRASDTAWNLLHPTDWYVVRKYETSAEIPQNILDYRAAIRSAYDACSTSIDNISDYTELTGYNCEFPTFSG